jgi:hypothetical protein
LGAALAALLACGFWHSAAADVQFVRGDANVDGGIDISDAVAILSGLFGAGAAFRCDDAADVNNDGDLNIADAVWELGYLFADGKEPPAPFTVPGCDPPGDQLGCRSFSGEVSCGESSALVANHTTTDLSLIPTAWIEAAKANFRIWYGHTSHGSQIMTGLDMMRDALFAYNSGAGSLSIDETGIDLGNPDWTTWAAETREQLDRADNTRNMVMWSWCGQVSGATAAGIQRDYLELMSRLEADYPGVTFIYMTGHLDGSGVEGNLNQRNNQIRDYCAANDKILFDFADIESYDPGGNYYLDLGANDNCDYQDPDTHVTRNWAIEWCAAHAGACGSCECAHSQCLNCQRKGKAFWHLLARIAGGR